MRESLSFCWFRSWVDLETVITVDLRDAVGDRLFLSGSLRREGVMLSFLLLVSLHDLY